MPLSELPVYIKDRLALRKYGTLTCTQQRDNDGQSKPPSNHTVWPNCSPFDPGQIFLGRQTNFREIFHALFYLPSHIKVKRFYMLYRTENNV